MKKTFLIPANRKNRRMAASKKALKKLNGTVFVLMSLPAPIHAVTAVLDMPDDYANRLLRAQEIITACTGNANVTVPAGDIDQAKADLKTYTDAATSAAKNAAYRLLVNDLNGIMFLFQRAANAAPANAIVIIESGLFKVKTVNPRGDQEFAAENGIESGSVLLTAPGGDPRSCHDWKYSADGIIFVREYPTIAAETEITGLPVGKLAYFTHEEITKDGPQGISQVIEIMVK